MNAAYRADDGGGSVAGQPGTARGASLLCNQADRDLVEAIVARAGTSFARGMRVLPPLRRFAMYAIYAFCREVDDIADGDAGVADPDAALAAWHERIGRLYAGETRDGLDRALASAIRRFDLVQADFDAIIDGMAMDAAGPIIAPDEAALDQYCDRVASAVGRLSVRVFGDSSEEALRVAHHLGRALQLTNILRDLQEDADRGRLYLPRELLQRFAVPADPQEALYARGLDPLCRIIARRARDHFRLAREAMARCDRVAMRPARMMAASYRCVLDALERKGWRHPERAVKVSRPLRVAHVLHAYFR